MAEDLRFQRGSWVAQRFGLAGLVVFLFCGALGLLGGGGPLSNQRRSSDKVALVYERFIRADTPAELEISLRATAEFTLDSAFFERVRFERFHPVPVSIYRDGDVVVFRFTPSGTE